ncbi:unnamed protein product, partial [Rotaria magnacalcarata]
MKNFHLSIENYLEIKNSPNDVAAERAIERAMKEAQDQIAKGAAD